MEKSGQRSWGVSCSYVFTSEYMQAFITNKSHLKKKKNKKEGLR